MKQRMTKGEARAFQKRWKAVNKAEAEELRRTSTSDKLRQLSALMASIDQLGWREALEEEEASVRDRWNQLRKAYRA
jgi:hypothetical protein